MKNQFIKLLSLLFLFLPFISQVSAQEDGTVSHRLIWQFEYDQPIQLVEWCPMGDKLALATENNVIFVDVQSGEEIYRTQIQ